MLTIIQNLIKTLSLARAFFYGTEIDGTIAALKRLVERQSNYLKPGVEDSEYLNNLNVKAIAVSDIMHANESNQQYYNLNQEKRGKYEIK